MSAACTFVIHSHFVLIKNIKPAAIPAVNAAIRNQVQYSMEKRRGRFVRVSTRVFAAKDYSGKEYRFHIHQLEDLIHLFGNYGIRKDRIEIVTRPLYLPKTTELKIVNGKVPRENQVPIIEYVVSPGATKVVALQTGQGKAQPLDCKVKVPGGWVEMGDVHPGMRVMTKDHGVTTVTKVHPQPTPLTEYVVTLEDGRSTRVSGDHLWLASLDSGGTGVATTLTLLKTMSKQEVFLPLSEVDTLSEPVHELKLPFTVTELVNLIVNGTCSEHSKTLAPYYGLLDPNSLYIPPEYFEASGSTRLDLLEGISKPLDIDVPVTCSYSNLRLAKDVIRLARSLGYLGTLLDSDGSYEVYNVRLTRPSIPRIKVKDIVAGETVRMQCISLDSSEQLYITDDYIVTHNTYCGLKAGEIISERILIQVLGRYFEKWAGDVQDAYGIDPDRFIAIRGAKKFKQFLDNYHLDPESHDFDVMMITSRTMQDYMSEYEMTGFRHLPKGIVRPEDIYESLGIGYRIIDEAHQHFHNNFKTDLYTHMPKCLYLSATLNPDDPFLKDMYDLAYPPHLRMDGGKFIKYCKVLSVDYQLRSGSQPKYLSPQGTYNHIVYEEWIMKDKDRLNNYLKMIEDIWRKRYMDVRKEGQKCLIFAGSVEMCEIITNYLRGVVTGEVISKYTSEDDYDVLLNSNTVVSTLGSSGTAVDIINLSVVIMTTALSGSQANIQAVGRLRELVNYLPDKPLFIYLTCIDIDKHVDYKAKKKELLAGRVLTHRSEFYADGV